MPETSVNTAVVMTGGAAAETQFAKLLRMEERAIKLQAEVAAKAKATEAALRAHAAASGKAATSLSDMSKRAGAAARGLSALAPIAGSNVVQFASYAGALGNVADVADDMAPKLATLKTSLQKIGADGRVAETTLSSLVPSMAQLGVAAAAAAAAFAITTGVINPLVDSFFAAGQSQRELQTEFEKTETSLKKQQQALAELGTWYRTGAEAVRALADARKAEAAAQQAVTSAVETGNLTAAQQVERVLALRDGIAEMSDAQLVRYKAQLDAATTALQANGEAVDDVTLGVQKLVEMRLREDAAVTKGLASFERAHVAARELAAAQDDLAAQLRTVYDKSVLSEKGFLQVAEAAAAFAKNADGTAATLDEDLNAQLTRLGVNLEDVRAAMDRAAATGTTFAAAMKAAGAGWDPAMGKEIEKQYKTAQEKQTAAWEAEDKKRLEMEKASIDAAAKKFKETWGVEIPATAITLETQFGNAMVKASERAKTALSQIGKALAQQANASRSGGGGGKSEVDPESPEGKAKAVLGQAAALKRKQDELLAIEKHFSRKGGYAAEVAKRKQEIADMDSELNSARGGRSRSADRLNKKFNAMAGEAAKSPEQVALERQFTKHTKEVTKAVKHEGRMSRAVAEEGNKLMKGQAQAFDEYGRLLSDSGVSQKEANGYLAALANKRKLPSAAVGRAAAKKTVITAGSRGGSGGSYSRGSMSGG